MKWLYEQSEEIMRHSLARKAFSIHGSRFEDLKIFLQVFVQLHDGGHIAAPVVIIWGRPHCHQFFVKHVFVPFHNQLMSPCNQAEPIVMAELVHSISPVDIPCSSSWYCPSLDLVGVRPQDITHNSFLWNFFNSFYLFDVFHIFNIGRKTSVDTEDLIVHNRG